MTSSKDILLLDDQLTVEQMKEKLDQTLSRKKFVVILVVCELSKNDTILQELINYSSKSTQKISTLHNEIQKRPEKSKPSFEDSKEVAAYKKMKKSNNIENLFKTQFKVGIKQQWKETRSSQQKQ